MSIPKPAQHDATQQFVATRYLTTNVDNFRQPVANDWNSITRLRADALRERFA